MSPHKRKAGAGTAHLKETFDAIIGLIARVKPKLADVSHTDHRSDLEEDLLRLATLGETFTEQRQRTKISAELADTLDREGVHLWNISGLVREGSESGDDRKLYATLRLTGLRLIEAGIELKPSVETLINVLQLASKAGIALSDCGMNETAASVLGSAAKFEDQLRKLDGAADENLHEQAKAQATLLYYNSRMVAAWRIGNDAIAWFMLEKITDSEEKLHSMIAVSDRELLAAKILEIGRSILKASTVAPGDGATTLGDSKRAQDSVKWIQRAFSLVEKMEGTESPGMAELKRGVLRSLARAYYLSSTIEPENLARADASLKELLCSVDGTSGKVNPEYQQLRWMRLAVLKKQKASGPLLEEAFQSLVDNATFTETEITEILQELRTMSQQHEIVSNVLKRCIRRLLEGSAESAEFVDRFLLALLSHCAKDQDHSQAMKDIETGCTYLTMAEYELKKIPATACLAVLWKIGDRLYQNKKWLQAAEWFLAGTHKAFINVAHMSGPKCLRKAALCYLEQRDYAQASQVIRRCPAEHATTYYLLFLVAIYQGFEDDAVSAIQDMVKSSDFDRRMLLLATQLAHDSDSKRVLLVSLEALLKTVRSHGATDADVEAILLSRCIIRLVIRLEQEAPVDNDRALLVSSLVSHSRTALSLVEAVVTKKDAHLVTKDVSWLWRTIYNAAVQGCSTWQHAESAIADLFEIAHEFMVLYTRLAVGGVDLELHLHMIYSTFSSISARMFIIRSAVPDDDTLCMLQKVVLEGIQKLKKSIASVKEQKLPGHQPESEGHDEILHLGLVFEVELHCQRQEWSNVLSVIKEVGSSSLRTYESIADILWSDNNCPVDVLYAALESLLHACLDHRILSTDKFARWLRAICSILLTRNISDDRTKALNYIIQAIEVLKNQNEVDTKEYPMEERQWLLSTTYNTGVECLVAFRMDQAKRWFEVSTVICRFIPDGAHQSEKISETYRRLLEQYSQ